MWRVVSITHIVGGGISLDIRNRIRLRALPRYSVYDAADIENALVRVLTVLLVDTKDLPRHVVSRFPPTFVDTLTDL